MQPARGKLFVVAAPSGAGKTSLVRALMKRMPDLKFSISYTTRKQRPTERNEHDYFFVDKPTFERMIDAGEFLEHAQVFDNYYGTSRAQVQELLDCREQCVARDRLAGSAADSHAPCRRSGRSSYCRRRAPNSNVVCVIARPTATKSSRAGCATRSPTCRTGMSSTTSSSMTTSNAPSVSLQSIVAGQGESLRRDRSALETLIRSLLG